jgi:ADP-heptose:LPS heptosyltransferase
MDLNTENIGNSGFWEPDVVPQNIKKMTNFTAHQLGITLDNVNKVDRIEDLRESPPNIIIAQARFDVTFVQNYFKTQTLKKKVKFVMGLGVFQQLQRDPNGGKRKLLKPCGPKFQNVYRPYTGQNLDNKSILVFRTGGIGDLLFIQPNLRYIKEKYPTCHIAFACGPQYQPMLETWECIDEVLDLPFSFSKLQKSSYHVLFEGVIERCRQAETDNAYNLFSKWMGLDLPDERLVPIQIPKPELVEKCRGILSDWKIPEKSFVVMQLRASSPIRSPRPGFWLNLANKLTENGHHILLTDNPRQSEKVDEFIKTVYRKDMVHNFCTKSEDIAHSIAVISLAEGVIATDSAMNHIAASVDVPAVGIMGPFPGHIRFKTYPKMEWLDSKRPCAHCYLHGTRPCHQAGADGFSPCYDEINITELVEKYETLIERCK